MNHHDSSRRHMALVKLSNLFHRIDQAVCKKDFEESRLLLKDLPDALSRVRDGEPSSLKPRDNIEEGDVGDPTARQSHFRDLRPPSGTSQAHESLAANSTRSFAQVRRK